MTDVDERAVAPHQAVLAAGAAHIAVNAVAIALLPSASGGARVRGLQHLYDLGHHLAALLLVAAVVAAWFRWGPKRVTFAYVALTVASLATLPLVADDLVGFASRHATGTTAEVLRFGFAGALALAVPVVTFVTRRVAHKWLRLVPLLGGLAALVGNHVVLRGDYRAAHLMLVLYGVALIAGALTGVHLPRWARALDRAAHYVWPTLIAVWTVVVWPSNNVLLELLRVDGSVVSPLLSRLHAGASVSRGSIPVASRKWFESRENAPSVPPTRPAPLGDDGVVILILVDSLRADLLSTEEGTDTAPSIARLRDQSVDFVNARAPGSQTVVTVASLFMGTYFSQQYWSKHGKTKQYFPHEDESVRFPAILSKAGVPTTFDSGAYWLVGEYGLVGGFSEERQIKSSQKTRYATADDLVPLAIKRLDSHGAGRLFLYLHLFDVHFMNTKVREKSAGGAKGQYLAGLRRVSRHLEPLFEKLEQEKWRDRAAIILTSDHGEAFGEHGKTRHSTTLYDELLRVPIYLKLPGVKPRKDKAPVSVIDLGPTALDLLGQSTPGHFMGQSLVGRAVGRSTKLTRPIAAEGRLKKAMVFDDRHKVIVDDRNNTAEFFDLDADPEEEENLMDVKSESGKERTGLLRIFFDAHKLRKDGYRPPYRK